MDNLADSARKNEIATAELPLFVTYKEVDLIYPLPIITISFSYFDTRSVINVKYDNS